MTDNTADELPVNRQVDDFFILSDGFAKRLRELRAEAGLTQSELGEEIGVALSAVNAWENETRPPAGGAVLIKLAKTLRCSLDYLLTSKQNTGVDYLIAGLEQLLDEARNIQRGGEPDAIATSVSESEPEIGRVPNAATRPRKA